MTLFGIFACAIIAAIAYAAGVFSAPYVSAEFQNLENDLRDEILDLREQLAQAEEKIAIIVKPKKVGRPKKEVAL